MCDSEEQESSILRYLKGMSEITLSDFIWSYFDPSR